MSPDIRTDRRCLRAPRVATRRLRAAAVVLAVSLVAAACSGGDSGDAGPSSTSTTTAVRTSEPPRPEVDSDAGFEVVVPDPDPTSIGVDPDVRIGTLGNGLTYYLRENDSPGGRVELRVAVNVGSVQQDDPASGLAHFVEHMVFNGTERFPGNELDKALQDLGLAIGNDVNAFTSFDETVYSLSVASASDDIELAFDVLLEAMTAATMEPDAVIEERGVVREERRANTESPDGRQFDVFIEAYTRGTGYAGASPIGTASGILATTAVEVREFYDRWYRPDMMAVVVVGDLSLDDMEDEVRDRFEDMVSRGDERARAEPEAPPIDDRWVDVLIDAETASRRVSLDYWIPTWHAGTIGGERLLYLEAMLGEVIDNRLNDAVDRGQIDAISPFVGPFELSRRLRFLGFNFGGDDLAVATEQVIAELRRIEVLGVTDAEVARVVEQFRGSLRQFLDGLGTTQDDEFADAYVNHYLSGAEIDEATSTVQRLGAILDEVDADDLTAHFRYLMSVSAPLLAALGQTADDLPTVAELEAALDRGLAVEVDGSAGPTAELVTELMEVPDRVSPTRIDEVEDLVAKQVVFANGVRALFIESDISEGAVELIAVSDGGWSVLDGTDARLADIATLSVQESGVADLDSVQLDRFLDGSVVSLVPFIDEIDEGFFGSASNNDVELLFQLLHLAITEPRVDTAAFRSAIESTETAIRSAGNDPQTLSVIELFDARYGGRDLPRVVTTQEAVDAASAEDVLRIYRDRLGSPDDLVVVVAGDADEGVVIELFERYLGSLPSSPTESPVDLWPSPPAGLVRRSVTAGSAAAGAGVDFLFTAETAVDERTMLVAEVIANIVRSRLFDTVREDLGASYGANVFVSASTEPDEVIETFILANGDPDRLELIRETILAAVHDLATEGPTPAEFARARGILSSDFELVSNFDLMTALVDMARGDSLDPFTKREAFDVIGDISRDDVARLADEMFPLDRWIEVERS